MISGTVKLGDKERFDKGQISIKGFFTDYQPFYMINLRLDKELLPIKKMTKLGVSEHEIVKIGKKEGTNFGILHSKESPKFVMHAFYENLLELYGTLVKCL